MRSLSEGESAAGRNKRRKFMRDGRKLQVAVRSGSRDGETRLPILRWGI